MKYEARAPRQPARPPLTNRLSLSPQTAWRVSGASSAGKSASVRAHPCATLSRANAFARRGCGEESAEEGAIEAIMASIVNK